MSTTIVSPMPPCRRTSGCPPKLPSSAASIDAIASIFAVLRRLTRLPGGTASACPMTVTMLSPRSNALMRLGSGASPSPIATITAESRLSMASSAFTSPADKESIAGDNPTNPSRSRRASTASITVSALRSPTAVTSISSRHVQVVFITNWPGPVLTFWSLTKSRQVPATACPFQKLDRLLSVRRLARSYGTYRGG